MKLPTIKFPQISNHAHTDAAPAQTAALEKRTCGSYDGYYSSAQYSGLGLKFNEHCVKIGVYDPAFEKCNFTRTDEHHGDFYQVKNWESNSRTLYANDTVPDNLLGCLYGTIPQSAHTSAKIQGVLIGEIVGGIAGAALLGATLLACCCCGPSLRRRRRDRAQAQQPANVELGNMNPEAFHGLGSVSPAHIR